MGSRLGVVLRVFGAVLVVAAVALVCVPGGLLVAGLAFLVAGNEADS